jgi:effector-binding domain-containing protein
MNKILIISLIVLAVLTVAYIVGIQYMENVETQQYMVKEKFGDIEIRNYGKSIVAKTSTYGDYDKASGSGFGKLAGYIFGGNAEEQKIAMTAPVWMTMDNEDQQMQFVMPSKYKVSDLPQPSDPSVSIDTFTGGQFASIRFGGYTSEEKNEKYRTKLLQWLEENNYQHSGETFYAGYNSPFKIFNRRNEILIALH